jgi:tripartite-type tricarboxylate transporter receptor subunit TctC
MPGSRKVGTIARAIGIAIASTALLIQPALAQEWPTRPIRILVGFGPGGGTDIVTRIVAQPLSELLGQPIVVDNKPGAGGTIASDLAAKASPDGYTASMLSSGHTVSAAMYKSLPYESVKDFAPVALVANAAYVVVANKDFAANDINALVAAAKAKPGQLKFATVGLGSTQHFTAELLAQRTGISVKHVPYKRTPDVIAALRSNEVDYAVELVHATVGQVRAGDLKYLGVSTGARWPQIPDVPTIGETAPGFDVVGWYGLVFPAGTPAAIVEKTNKALREVLAREEIGKQIANAGALPNISSPQDFGKHLASEVDRWRDVAKKSGIEPQ